MVVASKLDLAEASQQGIFPEDLYYRLNVVTIEIPPLRDRMEDISLLFQHFLLLAMARYDREAPSAGADQIRTLPAYRWPGNVRELHSVADCYVLLGHNFAYDLERLIHGNDSEVALTLPQQVECFEKSLIAQALGEQKGNIKRTMGTLGIPRKTLYDKMKNTV